MEFFLARKIYDELRDATFMLPVLNTRRFDRKIVYFLTHLDAADAIRPPLQQILRSAYVSNVSENAQFKIFFESCIRNSRPLQVQ
jgi:hypothetical protein